MASFGNLEPWTYSGKANYAGVGDNARTPNHSLNKINMMDIISKRNKFYYDIANNRKPVDYTSVNNIKPTANDFMFSRNSYINGHPKNIVLVPYPRNNFKMNPDIHYEEGRNPTLLKSVKDRWVDVDGIFVKKDSIKNKPIVDSSLKGVHRIAPKVF